MTRSRLFDSALRKPWTWAREAALLGLFCAGAAAYLYSVEAETRTQLHKDLAAHQVASVKQFEGWMDERIAQTLAWARRDDVRALVKELVRLKDSDPAVLRGLPLQAAFRAQFAPIQGRQGTHGYFIVSPEGRNLGTLIDDNLGLPNLTWQEPEFVRQMRLRGSALSPFMSSDVPLANVGAVLDDKPMTMFVGVPVYLDETEPSAYFLLRLPTVGLLAEQGRARFEQSGISSLIDQFGRLHADRAWINLDLEHVGLHSELFRGRRYLFARDPGHNVMTYPHDGRKVDRAALPLTRSAKALQQGDGSTLEPYRDHRGVPVVGSWTWSEKLGLGVVTEVPASEAFAPVIAARQNVLLAAVLLALGTVALLVFRLHSSRALLRQAVAQAEAANASKGVFLANMSHEIRTPLNAVLGIAHLLSTTSLVPTQREYLNIISSSGQTLLSILNDILDYSKVEAGRLELLRADFSLHDMIDTLASIMSINAAPKDLELVIGVDPDVPAQLVGDSHRLLQVLINLTGNAIKFTRQGDVVLRVSLARRTGQQVHVRFEVVDSGVGIPLAKQGQLFAPFMQADARVARSFGGTGLGLAICKRLVDLMQGEIGLESEEGKGSKFWFVVPLDAVREGTPAPHPLAAKLQRAMVVDDNAMAREFVMRSLERLGWQARGAESGPEAIRALGERLRPQGENVDAVLVDWKMPGMDGLETAQAVRSLNGLGDVPIVVMVSAFARDQLLASPHAELADAVISKPATPSKILDAVLEAQAKRHRGSAQVLRAVYAPPRVVNRLKGLRILLVEDNYINQQVARGVLAAEGAVVSAVDHGEAALAALARDPTAFDLVLMDVQMPVMDGIEATQRLRGDLRFTRPIVAMSAGVTQEERQRCTDAGMNGFIAKPLEPQVVVQTIRALELRLPVEPGPRAEPAVEGGALLEVPGMDVEELLDALNGNQAAVGRLLERLEVECGKAVADLDRSLAAGDHVEFAAMVHGFKGVAANMRARGVAQQAEGLEAALRAKDLAALNGLYPSFRADVLALQQALNRRAARAA